jgi:hypothetical protein
MGRQTGFSCQLVMNELFGLTQSVQCLSDFFYHISIQGQADKQTERQTDGQLN